jgi:hypothetical protein
MPGEPNQRAFETDIEEILLARGSWKSVSKS